MGPDGSPVPNIRPQKPAVRVKGYFSYFPDLLILLYNTIGRFSYYTGVGPNRKSPEADFLAQNGFLVWPACRNKKFENFEI